MGSTLRPKSILVGFMDPSGSFSENRLYGVRIAVTPRVQRTQ